MHFIYLLKLLKNLDKDGDGRSSELCLWRTTGDKAQQTQKKQDTVIQVNNTMGEIEAYLNYQDLSTKYFK